MWLLDIPTHHAAGNSNPRSESSLFFNHQLFVLISEKLLCFRYYSGSTLDCIAQTEPLITKTPPDKFKKYVKYKTKLQSNGVENGGFQDEADEEITLKTSNSLEDLSTIHQKNEENRTGVKKKSPRGLTRSESTNVNGTKKKIRNSRSLSKEYYQLWAATSSPEAETAKLEDGFDKDMEEKAPPLPPRSLHRPLERSHALSSSFKPPIVLRQNKPKVWKLF